MNLPALGGNWVDLIIIIIILFYLLEGWGRGFILGVVDLGGFLLSFLISLKFYSLAGDVLVANFSLPRGIANAVGFLFIGFLTEVIFSLLVNLFYRKIYPRILAKLAKQQLLPSAAFLNRFTGFIPAVGEALVFIAFILTLLISLPITGAIKKDITSSKIGRGLIVRTQGIEKDLKTIFGQAVNESLTFLTINPNPESGDKVDLRFTQKETKIDEAAESTMLNLVNGERVRYGLRHLSLSFPLREVARDHAKDMFGGGYFSHYNPQGESPFDRMEKRDIKFSAAGENLALAPNVDLAHQGLMNSPGHRANILSSDFGKVGIGVIDGGIYGEMFVQEFTD